MRERRALRHRALPEFGCRWRRRLQTVALGIVLLAELSAAFATPGERRFERLAIEHGLSHHEVHSLVQDSRGFLWIGTGEGLNRYDGHEMAVFRRGTPHGLGSNRISALLVTSEGQLWVGTRGGGLSLFDPTTERFTTYRHLPDDPQSLAQDDVMDLAEDQAGRIWIATARGGLSRLDDPDQSSVRFVNIRHEPNDGTTLADDRTRDLLVDRQGRVWVGTMAGLDLLTTEEPPRFTHYRNEPSVPTSLPDDEVWSLLEDSDGVIWVGSWGGGVARLSDTSAPPEQARFEAFTQDSENPLSLSDSRVMALHEDSRGTIWIGTLGGLMELLPSERRQPTPRFLRHESDVSWPHSLADDRIHEIIEDSRGDLWIGTDGGLSQIDRSLEPFQSYRYQPDRPDGLGGAPGSALVDESGALWVTHDAGVDRIVPAPDRFSEPGISHFGKGGEDDAPFPARRAYQVMEDRLGYLWFATHDGLVGLAPEERSSKTPRFLHYPEEALSSNAVLSLYEDAFGTLWVGTYRALHRVIRDQAGRPIDFPSFTHDRDDPLTLSSRSVSAIAGSADGTLWVGTYSGLNRLDPSSGRVTRHLPDISRPGTIGHGDVTSLLVDSRDRLWVGTRGGGLNRLKENGDFEVLGVTAGLPSDIVHSLREGPDGHLWFATPAGLVDFDPDTGEVEVLGQRQGLAEAEIETITVTLDGRLVVASPPALTVFEPQRIKASTFVPPIELTGLRVLNQPVPIGSDSVLRETVAFTDEVVLHHSDYLVGFEFAALSFRQAESPLYRYRLEGLNDDWIETDAGDGRAVYSTLPPGDYTFRVQAATRDGLWNTEGARVAVKVLPPWWFTWWARLGAGLIVVLTAASWPLLRLKRARRRNAWLEIRVAERTQELAEAMLKLEAASRTDDLTGLPNRRHFLARAEDAVATYRRTGRPFSLALADIDDFKSINDTWGHECGDHVLCAVAELLGGSLREVDMVARWGGEEFIFLFPDTGVSGAATVTEKARVAVSEHDFRWHGRDIPVTLTAGVAQVKPGGSLDACGAAADAALYRGKHNGKNRVVVDDDADTSRQSPRAVS